MPIKVQYDIYDTQHKAPIISTSDRTMASIEFNDLLRKGGDLYRLQQTPIADGALTKAEEYLMLVYRVRKLWNQYFNQGRDQEVLKTSLEQEKKLDDWNKRTKSFIDSHPGYKPADPKSHAFYVLVSGWREAWKDRKRYSKQKGCDEDILKELSRKCRDFEKQIDKYVKDNLGLI